MATKTIKPKAIDPPSNIEGPHAFVSAFHCTDCATKYYNGGVEPHDFIEKYHCQACLDHWHKPGIHLYVNKNHCGVCYAKHAKQVQDEYESQRKVEAERERERQKELDKKRCKECGLIGLCMHKVRTQKARGILALQRSMVEGRVPLAHIIQDESEVASAYSYVGNNYGKVFARPCPVRPRHGFVDSRPVTSVVQALEVFTQAKAADPEAEMILMPMINATCNAVWTPSRVAIGPGHDGATSGRKSFSLPLVVPTGIVWLDKLKQESGVAKGDEAFIEAVYAESPDGYWITQVRGGPRLPTNSVDYIPTQVTVTNVVRAEGDLLEWETKTTGFTPGTVVWHPGGSMASHYAIHCVLNNVPVIISFEPHVGQNLQPNTEAKVIDMQSVLTGIGAGTAINISRTMFSSAVGALLIGLHNVSAFSGEDGYWVGAAAALMQRLGAIALLGEARHATYREGLDREEIYTQRIQTPFQSRRRLHRAMFLFENYPWRSGYGGKAWADCGQALLKLDSAIRDFTSAQRKKHYTALVSALNEAVNQAHNGGWWLNKFTNQNLMDQAASNNPLVVFSSMSMLYRLRTIETEEATKMVRFWQVVKDIPVSIEPDGIKPELKPSSPHFIKKPFNYNLSSTLLSPKEAKVKPDLDKVLFSQEKLNASATILKAQAKVVEGDAHIQYVTDKTPPGKYLTKDVSLAAVPHKHNFHSLFECIKSGAPVKSLADSDTSYYALNVVISGSCMNIQTGCGAVLASFQKHE